MTYIPGNLLILHFKAKYMSGSNFGSIFKLTSFGESHGLAVGGFIEGVPPGIELDFEAIQLELDRRKPGLSKNLIKFT